MKKNVDDIDLGDRDTFFDPPKFWYHLKRVVLYPYYAIRYRILMRHVLDTAERWRKNTFNKTEKIRPELMQQMLDTEFETRIKVDGTN
ncbi:MAG: hypothetical protein AB7V46_02985 [Thermomicrobiales bacterium]